jgi:nitroreductase
MTNQSMGLRFAAPVISAFIMLTTKEAIEQRRSIRKFKPDPVPEEHLTALLDAARLAPSGSNAQPWRFKVVKDKETRLKLAQAAYNQSFIADAPIVLVCCADIKGYLDGSVSGIQDLGKIGAVEGRIMEIILERADKIRTMPIEQLGARIAFNVAIAIEHIVLRALDFGLGSCWIRLVDEQVIKDIFGWDDNISVFALLPIGYPAESPPPRKRLKLEEIIVD